MKDYYSDYDTDVDPKYNIHILNDKVFDNINEKEFVIECICCCSKYENYVLLDNFGTSSEKKLPLIENL